MGPGICDDHNDDDYDDHDDYDGHQDHHDAFDSDYDESYLVSELLACPALPSTLPRFLQLVCASHL